MGTGRGFRFAQWTLTRDGSTEPEHSMLCVSGEGSDCGARPFGRAMSAEALGAWAESHFRETGHRHFRREFSDRAQFELIPDIDPVEGGGVSP